MKKIASVLFLLGCNEGQSKRYRVFNHIEYLRSAGLRAEWAWDIHAKVFDPEYVSRFDIIAVFRSGTSDRLERFYKLVKHLNIPMIYDIDDLVFDPSIVDQIDVYNRMSDEDKENYREGIYQVYEAIEGCDYISASTSYLADYLHKIFHKPSYVIPFGVSEEQIAISKRIQPWNDQVKFLGYLSGTATHHKDFEQAASAVEKLLLEHDDLYLKVVGPLDTDTLLPKAKHKIVKIGFMDWRDLVIETASLYINLAPFDHVTPFCKSKSQLKFIEASMCSVPTVASPVPSYTEAIDNGVNGFIADTPDEWYKALKSLVADPEYRNQVAFEANQYVSRNHYPNRITSILLDVYNEVYQKFHAPRGASLPVVSYPVMPKRQSGLRISWIIPQPFEGSGGHRNIFRTIKYLSEFGHSLTLYILPDNHRFSTGAEARDFITQEFFDIKADKVVWGVDQIEDCDILVSTYWTTAYHARSNADKTTAQIYFLQDFEPMFFPMGTDYVRAMQTYKFGFRFVCSGPWPLRMLDATLGLKEGDFFRFPVDREIYQAASYKREATKKRVAYFARPDMPRRCYSLGVAALEIVKKKLPNIEIVFYGDRAEKFQNIPFDFTALGMTKTIKELGDLYRKSDVGICFSTTNPSLVPFEMMACGCPVVDLDVNGNDVNYGSSDNACLVEPDPEKIAEGIIRILTDANYARQLSANGVEYAKIFPSELDMVKTIEGFFLTEYEHAKSIRLANIKSQSVMV